MQLDVCDELAVGKENRVQGDKSETEKKYNSRNKF